jgi:hypothetical protein
MEKRRYLHPSNFKTSYCQNNLSMEDILMNLSILKNPNSNQNLNLNINLNTNLQILNETCNLNITQEKLNDSISINNNSILQNSSMINANSNANNRRKYNQYFNPNQNMNQNKSIYSKQNNFTKVATSIIIDENICLLNQKLKKANDYYNAKNNKNLNNLKDEIITDNVSEINIDHSRSRSPDRMKFNYSDINNNNKSMHVSGYIKNFINQAHEENYFDENEDIFKLKNCKINSKGKKFLFINKL